MSGFISLLICFLYFVTSSFHGHSSEIFDKDDEGITHQHIATMLSSLNIEQQQKLSNNITSSKALIETKLNCYCFDEGDNETIKYTKDIIRIFETTGDDFKKLKDYELCYVGSHSLTLLRYLEFCVAMTPSSKRGSFCSYTNAHVVQILNDLNRECSDEKMVWQSITLLRNILNKPFSLTPYDLYCFKIAFDEVILFTQAKNVLEGEEDNSKLTYAKIAGTFSDLSYQEIMELCTNIHWIKNEIRNKITLAPPQLERFPAFYSSEREELNKINLILKMFEEFPDELHFISKQVVWSMSQGSLTLQRYFQFYKDMNPNDDYDNWIPFIKKERFVGAEILLKRLGLNPDAQYSEEVRKLLRKLRASLKYPLSLSPLKISNFRFIFQKLQNEVSQYKIPQSWSDLFWENLVVNNKYYI